MLPFTITPVILIKTTYHHFQKMTRGIGMDHSQYLFSFSHHWLEFWLAMYKTLELFLQEILPEVQLKPGPLHNNLHDGFGDDHIHPLVKSFIGGTVDCFDAKSIPSAILLLANCSLIRNFLYLCPCYISK